jgi:small subunit ribosomal protein S12
MVTFHQLAYKKSRQGRFVKKKKLALDKCPQKKGACIRVTILTPKKPCSARRAIARVKIKSNKKVITCHIPGEGHKYERNKLVLVRGGRPNDLPAVKYKIIRGLIDDTTLVAKRKNGRSRFSIKNARRYELNLTHYRQKRVALLKQNHT